MEEFSYNTIDYSSILLLTQQVLFQYLNLRTSSLMMEMQYVHMALMNPLYVEHTYLLVDFSILIFVSR